MFDHVKFGVNDFQASKTFYLKTLGPLGVSVVAEGELTYGNDGKPTRSMEIIGFDLSKNRSFATSYDDRGGAEDFVVALDGHRWTIKGKSVRFGGSFDAKKNRLSGFWKLKGTKSRWQPWIRIELVRA